MREIEHLQKQWRDGARFRGLHASMSLENDGLVLGAKTLLAKRDLEAEAEPPIIESPARLALLSRQPVRSKPAAAGRSRGTLRNNRRSNLRGRSLAGSRF
ncbi:MAG TPA: hypothetical protein VMD53_18280 [Rhizomicrobium sp.]|nr:hypothetical protein [Rhizomicrobium sp.]